MNIEIKIKNCLKEALESIYQLDLSNQSITLEPTKKEFEGTYTFVVFPFVKLTKQSPDGLAQTLGNSLLENVEEIISFQVVKGFLNLSLSNSYFLTSLETFRHTENFGISTNEKVMVEFSSPNTNKPLHLGHLRNNFLGDSICRILEAYGYSVVRANLINDRGIHICKSMIAYERWGNNETPESSGLKGDHLVGKYYVWFDKEYKKEIDQLTQNGLSEEEAKKEAPIFKAAQQMLVRWEANDPETVQLWKKMNTWVYQGFNSTYKKIGVHFDHFYYESNTYLLGKDLVEEGLQTNTFYKKEDQSVWIDLTGEGLDHKLLLRGDGTSVYITQDLGTAELKFKDFACSKSIYVVGNEQDYHFQVLQAILKKLNKSYADGVYHMSYGMVDLPSGKMKSREGTVVDADDLVQEMIDTAKARTLELGKVDDISEEQASILFHQLGLGALKYYLLRVDPKKRMLFNPEESIDFQGNTGPFIQYTHARIASIIRKANTIGVDLNDSISTSYSLQVEERQVIEELLKYPSKLAEAAGAYAPSSIAAYVYDVAKSYNRFYAECPVFQENKESQLFRLQLSAIVAKTIQRSMLLLGIEVPNKM